MRLFSTTGPMMQAATCPSSCLAIKIHWNPSFLCNRTNDANSYWVTHQKPQQPVSSFSVAGPMTETVGSVLLRLPKAAGTSAFSVHRTSGGNRSFFIDSLAGDNSVQLHNISSFFLSLFFNYLYFILIIYAISVGSLIRCPIYRNVSLQPTKCPVGWLPARVTCCSVLAKENLKSVDLLVFNALA